MADILVVEDDLDLVETYTDLLNGRGHSVLHASRLNEACDLLAKHRPQIITLDLQLPGSSEASLANLMRLAKSAGMSKIIIISGHPERMTDPDWMQLADLVLTKPVENGHLLLMIDRLL